MDLNEFAVDPALYEKGRRIEFGDGAYIGVRSAGSEIAQKARERLWKPYASWKDVAPEIVSRLSAQWIAQGILTEMVGFTVDGAPLMLDLGQEADRDRLGKLLADPRFKAFRNRVTGIALDEANFQAEADGGLEKNSASSPAGNSSGANAPSN